MSDPTGGYSSFESSKQNDWASANQAARDRQDQSERDARAFQENLAASDRRNAEDAERHRSSLTSSTNSTSYNSASGRSSRQSGYSIGGREGVSGNVALVVLFGPALILGVIRIWAGHIGDWYTILTSFAIAAPIGLMVAAVLYGRSIWSHSWGSLVRLLCLSLRLLLGFSTWLAITTLLIGVCMSLAGNPVYSNWIETHTKQLDAVLPGVAWKTYITLFVVGFVRFCCVIK